jgi:20S proteasome alpha/beta subunit
LTVVVGFVCKDGIVIASDSELTAGFTKHPKQKVWIRSSPGLAFGVSGVESTTDLLIDYFVNATFDTGSHAAVRATIAEAVPKVFVPEYTRVNSISTAGQNVQDLAGGAALLGIFTDDKKPHLFAILQGGHITDHATRGFASIGSGAVFAEHGITVFSDLHSDLTLYQTKMLACRLVQTSVAAAGGVLGVGGEVQMAIVAPGSPPTATLLPNNDTETLDAVENWKKLEADRFHDHAPASA